MPENIADSLRNMISDVEKILPEKTVEQEETDERERLRLLERNLDVARDL